MTGCFRLWENRRQTATKTLSSSTFLRMKVLQIRQALGEKSRDRQAHKLALRRHSFAVNILNNGANIKTVASLLGHSGLKHTEKYTRAVDKLKEEAINSLLGLKF